MSLEPFTMAAIAEAEQAVKGHTTLDRRAGTRVQHHGAPVEQVASIEGWRPRTSTTPPDQRDRPPMSSSSMESQPPIELDDICPRAQGRLFRRPDGNLVYRLMPCGTKACAWCGPRLRAKWASQWAHAMAGDVVHRLVVTDAELAKLRRRKALQGAELGHIPGPAGTRVVYSSVSLGDDTEAVTDKIGALTRDFAAMPSDTRRRFLSPGWAQVVADAEAEAEATREPWECLGRVGRPMAQVRIIATELGLLVGGTRDTLVLRAPDADTELRLFALIRLQRGWHRRQAAA
jgi:hypothetical protein